MAAHPITLEPDLQQKLEDLAAKEYCSPEVLIREAIESLIASRNSRSTPRSEVESEVWPGPTLSFADFMQEGKKAAEDYRQTGLHLTAVEVKQWIEQLRDNPNAKLPACHT